jgi:hypothetical protein
MEWGSSFLQSIISSCLTLETVCQVPSVHYWKCIMWNRMETCKALLAFWLLKLQKKIFILLLFTLWLGRQSSNWSDSCPNLVSSRKSRKNRGTMKWCAKPKLWAWVYVDMWRSELIGAHIPASCVCVHMCDCHMPHVTRPFYLSLYVSGYNSMATAMQLSTLLFDEQSHILQLWHDVTRMLYLLVYKPTPLVWP